MSSKSMQLAVFSQSSMRTLRILTLSVLSASVLSALLLSFSLPLLATEDGGADTGDTSGSVGSVEGVEGDGVEGAEESDYSPAVVVEPAAPDAVEQAWTTKFLVPTGLLIAAVALSATVVMYFVRVVRTRYKVVE